MIDESDPGEPNGEKHEPLPNARRMTEQECDAIYAAWDGGLRSSVSLGEKFGWSDETVRVLIKHGNKRRGWQQYLYPGQSCLRHQITEGSQGEEDWLSKGYLPSPRFQQSS